MSYLGWYDDANKRPVEEKIRGGAERYLAKHGRAATECLCNASDIGELRSLDGIVLKPTSYIRHNHFWLGEGEHAEQAEMKLDRSSS